MVFHLATSDINTKFGLFQESLFYDGKKEIIVLFMGDLEAKKNVLCRVHSSCIYGHYFNSVECSCQEEMDISQQLIQQAGTGLIILMDQEGKGNGHLGLMQSMAYKRQGIPQAKAYQAAGFSKDARDFSAAAKIIKHFQIHSVQLLTNNEKKVNTLEEFDVRVSGTRTIKL
jgi:GTP cyclohydrolase II